MTADFRAMCAELTAKLHQYAETFPEHDVAPLVQRACDLLDSDEHEGEVVELVEWLLREADYQEITCKRAPCADRIRRAAELLQRFASPAPVAERPWEREGWCDGEGRCWAWSAGNCGWWEWVDSKMILYSHDEYTHCLPFHALPLPTSEETSR